MRPILAKFRPTTDEPLQIIPDHIVAIQGSVLVNPSEAHDHISLPDIDWTSVAAINPHKALSWAEGHTFAGKFLSLTVVKHNGAHVKRGLEAESVICKKVNTEISHKLDGTVPSD